jgi:hypothetical protein
LSGSIRSIERSQAASDHRRCQEVRAKKCRHRIGYAILVLRDDRSVRDRQTQRTAEQRGNREPIRQTANHRCFGKGAQETPAAVVRFKVPRRKEQCGHKQQQAGREKPHPARRVAT